MPGDVDDDLDEGDEESSESDSATWSDLGLDPHEEWAWSESRLPLRAAARYISAGIDVEMAHRWDEAGFTARSAIRWCGLGLSPETATVWLDHGLPRTAATELRAFGMEPVIGLRWMLAGFTPAQAAQETTAGHQPPDLEWDSAGHLVDQWGNVPLADRVVWRLAGVGAASAADWNDYVHPDRDGEPYDVDDVQLFLHDAVAWESHGFSPYEDSLAFFGVYRSIGLDPPEAVAVRALLVAAEETDGGGALDLEAIAPAAKSYWSAGVPLTTENLTRWTPLTGDQVLAAVDRGFINAEEYRYLADLTIDESQVAMWRDEGVAAAEMRSRWVATTLHLDVETAAIWAVSSFTFDEIRTWLSCGLGPGEASHWVDQGFNAAQASAWRAVGIDDPHSAEAWIAQAFGSSDAGRWIAAGFAPHEAVAWARVGVDVAAASRRRNAGIEPRP